MNSPKDSNRISAVMATSSIDGITPVNLVIKSHRLEISNGTSGSSLPFVNAERDDNRIPVIWGVSSTDGITPIPIYANINGALLIKST